MSARSKVLTALALLGITASCSLTATSRDNCSKNSDCREAFGPGLVCSSDGLCERAVVNPRCTVTYPEDLLTRPESHPGTIVVGSIMDRSAGAQVGRENAIRLATTQVNEAGGLDQHLFGVVFCDIAENTQYDSLKRNDAAVSAGKYLADQLGVTAIIGPSASPEVVPVFQAIQSLDVFEISPAASSPELTGLDVQKPTDERPGLLWRTAIPDTLQGEAIVQHLRTAFPTAKNVVVIQEKGAYGDALAQVFTDAFAKASGTARPFVYANTSQRDAAIVDAGAVGAPVVLFISSRIADATAFLNAVQLLPSYATTTLFLTDTAATDELLRGASGSSAAFPRVIGSRPSIPQGPTYELFKTSFSGAFQQNPDSLSYVAHSYDAAWLTFYGVAYSSRREGKITGTGIARGLRKISAPVPEDRIIPGNWTKIADALGAGNGVNVVGASGALDYDPATEETTGPIDIWKISTDGSKIETVTTIDPR